MAEVINETYKAPYDMGSVSVQVDESMSTKLKALDNIQGVLSGNLSASSVLGTVGGVMSVFPAFAPVGIALSLISGLMGGGGGPSPMEVVSSQLNRIGKQINALANKIDISTRKLINEISIESESEKILAPIVTSILNINIESMNKRINLLNEKKDLQIAENLAKTKIELIDIETLKQVEKNKYDLEKEKLANMLRPVLTKGFDLLKSSVFEDQKKLAELAKIQKELDNLTAFNIGSFIVPLIRSLKASL